MITIQVDETGSVQVAGDIVRDLGNLIPGVDDVGLGDGTVLGLALDGDVWSFEVLRQGTASVEIEPADPEGDPATLSGTVTVDGQVPWIGLVEAVHLYDGMPPIDDPVAEALEQIRAGVQARHNAEIEARGETPAVAGDHDGPARDCTAGVCAVVRDWRSWLASQPTVPMISYTIGGAA